MSRTRRKVPRSRAEAKQHTHAALLAAGVAEFADHGFDASLDAICARAKLTRGAFYVHFADRDAFIVAVMQHVLGTFVAALTGGTDPRLPTIDVAIRLFLAAVRAKSPLVHGGPGLRFHHLLEACRRSPAIGDTYRILITTARDRLAALIPANGELEPAALADLLVLAAFGVLVATEIELPLDLDRLERAMLATITSRSAPARG